jgi:hypothetical protein
MHLTGASDSADRQCNTSPATPIPTAEIRISTPVFTGVNFSEAVPQKLREYIGQANIPSNVSIQVDVSQPGADGIRFRWVYALVAPFPTVKDGVTVEELRSLWTSGGTPLLMEESTLRAFAAIWGKPATGSVRSVEGSQLLETAWDESAWAIIPFESLEPKWKVLTVDGQSPIRKGFDPRPIRWSWISPFTTMATWMPPRGTLQLRSEQTDHDHHDRRNRAGARHCRDDGTQRFDLPRRKVRDLFAKPTSCI